jgi:membrane-associated phospholipid phosphatase
MEIILQWGLDFIRLAQSFSSPMLTAIMRVITGLGSPTVCMILFPFIYWCVDEKKGLRLGLAVLISAWINISLKFLFNQPRPFFEGYDPSLGMISERMGGFPSLHAQASLVLWTIIASWGKRKWLFGAAAIFCLLVGFSRIYLGIHFPTDILGGWILGALVLCAYFLLGSRIEALLGNGGFRAGMIASAALAFIMILYQPGEEVLMPSAVTLGIGVGYCLNRRYIGFRSSAFFSHTEGAIQTKYPILLARYILGIACLFLLLAVSEKLIPITEHSVNYKLVSFLKLAAAALWFSAGAPWLFCKIRLAKAFSSAETPPDTGGSKQR